MNYLQLCQRVREEVGFAGSGPASVVGQTGQLLEIVNAVRQSDIEVQHRWSNWDFLRREATIHTVALQATYGPLATGWPTDLLRWDVENFVFQPNQPGGYLLQPLDFRKWQQSEQFARPLTGKPIQIVIKPDESWILFPPPRAVYTILAPYYAIPVEMVADTDVSVIPAPFRDIIVWAAVKKLAFRQEASFLLQLALDRMEYWFDRLDISQTSNYVRNQGYAELNTPWSVRAE